MDDHALGSTNLAAFIAATAGRNGTVATLPGGVAVAGPVAVPNAFVDAAVSTDANCSPVEFLDDVTAFYAEQGRAFVLWAPASSHDLIDEATSRGATPDPDRPPAMSVHSPIEFSTELRVTPVASADDGAVFGDLAERGYEIPGLAWLLERHDSYRAPDITWVVVADENEPLGVGCGFASGGCGGVYYVATPPEHRGRGVAAAATTWVTNRLFAGGASRVVLQSSQAGLSVYTRLGFEIDVEYRRFTFADPRL